MKPYTQFPSDLQLSRILYHLILLLINREWGLKPRPYSIERRIARSIRQGRGLRISRRKDLAFDVVKIFHHMAFCFGFNLLARNRLVDITGELIMPYSWPIRRRVTSASNTSHRIIGVIATWGSCRLKVF